MGDANRATTNAELIDGFLGWLQHNRGRTEVTSVKYRGYISRLCDYYDGRPLGGLSLEELELFCGPVAVRSGLAGRSRRALVAAVRGLFAWMYREHHITDNPSHKLPYPKAPGKLPIALSLEHAEKLIWEPDLGTAMGLRDSAIIATLIGCGIRLGGLIGLNQEDLSMSEGSLLLRTAEKGGRERVVPVPREAEILIQAYIGHPEIAAIDRRIPGGKRVLFISFNNRKVQDVDYVGEERRLSRSGVQRIITKYGRRVGIPRAVLHPHAMRHLYGAELAEDDVDLLIRQSLMGHRNPSSTKIYSHLATRKLILASGKSNPLAKMSTPVTELLKQLQQG